MAIPCVRNNSTGSEITGQHLFLGATVLSFNVNMGWGGTPSSLTVELIEDKQPIQCYTRPLTSLSTPLSQHRESPINLYEDNHYYDCTGDSCYVDENGNTYNSNRRPAPLEKKVPGKIYYTKNDAGKLVSRYWFKEDPGFFGNSTQILPNGAYTTNQNEAVRYDILGTYVVFIMDNFIFSGIVKSWERNVRTNGITYSVVVEGADSILQNCHMILSDYGGAIYGQVPGSTSIYGMPTDYYGPLLEYRGKISSGNLHNVFNVYGFLESFGVDGFGGSKKNEEGIPAWSITSALAVLTSSLAINNNDFGSGLRNKRAFSPFGRILTKTMHTSDTHIMITPGFSQYGFGVMSPELDHNSIPRTTFVLDLSELPIPPNDYRISNPVMTVSDFLRTITADTGRDFFSVTIPAYFNNKAYNIIKVKVIDRTSQPSINMISNTIRQFENSGISITSSNIGLESNQNSPRVLYIGGKQQRLYQAKNYRLAYSQTNYVYSPILNKFVNFDRIQSPTIIDPTNPLQFGRKQAGKIKIPSSLSTRNPWLSNEINGGDLTSLWNGNESIKQVVEGGRPGTVDKRWTDAEVGGNDATTMGNYKPSQIISRRSTTPNSRYIPLYEDVICPFFGYQLEETISIDTEGGSNNFRKIRPVFLDTWTGNIVISMRINELPLISLGRLTSLLGNGLFTITETELRCGSFDEYWEYCLAKSNPTKPDMFVMLIQQYKAANIRIDTLQSNRGAGGVGIAGQPAGVNQNNNGNHNIEWQYLIHRDFINDLQILYNFIQNISNSYYGKKYMVRIPAVRSYKDSAYADLQLPSANDTISIFSGSSKIFYNFEPCDKAWEEPGNLIDDTLVIGTPNSYILANEDGTFPTILGYNATDSFDFVKKALCNIAINNASASWRQNALRYDTTLIMRNLAAGTCDDSKFYFPSLNLSSLSPDQYAILETDTGRNDAYDIFRSPPTSKKLYTTGQQSSEGIAFLNPMDGTEPRVIIGSPGLSLNSSSTAYETDPNITVIANAAIEDLAVYGKIYPFVRLDPKSGAISDTFINTLVRYVSPVIGNIGLFIDNPSNNQSEKHRTLQPKAAHPFFAAIPMRFNQSVYGPWTNYPAIIADSLFPTAINPLNAVENMIGNVNVESDPDLVPWEYGGMSFLDQAVLYKIQTNTDFQYILESAQLSMPGLPKFGIGGEFVYRIIDRSQDGKIFYNNDVYTFTVSSLRYYQASIDNRNPLADIPIPGTVVYSPPIGPTYIEDPVNYNILILNSDNMGSLAPIVSNLTLSIGADGATTNYSFRTYSKKLGIYSKENSDRLKFSARANIKRAKQQIRMKNDIVNSSNKQKQGILESSKGLQFATKPPDTRFTSRFGSSPTELLIGSAKKYVDCPHLNDINYNLSQISPQDIQGDSISSNITASSPPSYGIDPGDNTYAWTSVTGIMSKMRHVTWVGSFQSNEAFSELTNQYNMKSAMSMDGIFSPISFFPTLYDSTYPMASYRRSECPGCGGLGYVTDIYTSDFTKNSAFQNPQSKDFACPLCSRINPVLGSGTKSASGKSSEMLPPYIIASGTDISLLSSFISSNGSSSASSSTSTKSTINMYSLQPIVVPYGMFKNTNVQSVGERSRHSIQIVARGEVPQTNAVSFNINKNLLKYVDLTGKLAIQDGAGVNPDYYEYDILGNQKPLNNRFFGLRGPLMMHGWGYDTEGYPVPNAADEPKEIDAYGRPKRFILKSDGTNDYTSGGAFDPRSNQLGDIIGKGYENQGGKWVKKKSQYFHLNWAERPDLWPVGPIDLRWDETRKVWTTASSQSIYKMVYITLEEDLVKEEGFDETYPARGFLDDVEYSSETLPNNARRLVYIKDRSGFTAPRGAKLLCRYDSETGFYEPVSKPNYMVFGRIGSGTSATLELAYLQGIRRGENTPTMLANFDNSKFKFNIQSGKTGMFMFSNGKWLLLSVES